MTTIDQISELKEEMKKPEDRLTVMVNGAPQEIFMSGGLIRKLVPLIGDIESLDMIFTDAETQNMAIIESLCSRNKRGVPEQDVSIYDYEMSVEDSNLLVTWISEHVLYFFIGNVVRAMTIKETPQVKKMEKLMQSLAGTPVLEQPKPSVGPSIQSQAS